MHGTASFVVLVAAVNLFAGWSSDGRRMENEGDSSAARQYHEQADPNYTPIIENPEDVDLYTCPQMYGQVIRFAKLRRSGLVLIAAGSAATAAGLLLIINSGGETYYQNVNGQESGDLGGGMGAVIAGTGIQLAMLGVILAPIGAKKTREYKDRLFLQKCALRLGRRTVGVDISFALPPLRGYTEGGQ